MIEEISSIAFAVLVEEDNLEAFNDIMVTKFTHEELIEMSDYPEDYDPEYPIDVINDMEEIDVEDLYRLHLNKEYPLLEVYAFGARYGQTDGFAVFILETHDFIDNVGDFETKEPTEEGIAQLKKFQQEFAPNQTIGVKKWVHVC